MVDYQSSGFADLLEKSQYSMQTIYQLEFDHRARSFPECSLTKQPDMKDLGMFCVRDMLREINPEFDILMHLHSMISEDAAFVARPCRVSCEVHVLIINGMNI